MIRPFPRVYPSIRDLYTLCYLTLTKLPIQGVGSLADWASAILSFVAILVVFWQVNRESKNERAFHIENKRLHFSAERTTIINSDEKILYHESYGDLKNLYDELHGNKTKYIIRLTNTSENTVYSLKIILKYAGEKVERTKFKTAANELGYFHFHVDVAGDSTEYTFVKDKEPVSVYGDDVLIDKSSDKAKKLKEKFKEIVTRRYSRRIVTIPEEEFNDLKRYIQERKKGDFCLNEIDLSLCLLGAIW